MKAVLKLMVSYSLMLTLATSVMAQESSGQLLKDIKKAAEAIANKKRSDEVARDAEKLIDQAARDARDGVARLKSNLATLQVDANAKANDFVCVGTDAVSDAKTIKKMELTAGKNTMVINSRVPDGGVAQGGPSVFVLADLEGKTDSVTYELFDARTGRRLEKNTQELRDILGMDLQCFRGPEAKGSPVVNDSGVMESKPSQAPAAGPDSPQKGSGSGV